MVDCPSQLPNRRTALVAGAAALLATPQARAQGAWPQRPVRVVVPFPAGSTPDLTARVLADAWQGSLGQPVVVDNRPGAGGNTGTEAVAKAADGHTVGVTINGPLTTAPALYPRLGYDPRRDLALLSLLVRAPQLLVVHPALPVTDYRGFVAFAKANREGITYGSVGAGSASHLAMEELRALEGFEALHVPYRGFPPAVTDLVAGRINALFVVTSGVLPQVRSGAVRPLLVTATTRFAATPDVPSLREAGSPIAENYAWNGLIAPASFPAEARERLLSATREALASPRARTALETAGFEVVSSDSATFTAFVAAETERWGGLVRRLNITAE